MTDVYWLEQTEVDVPLENSWLSAREQVHLAGLRVAKRAADWRLGRWTAKCALAACLDLPATLAQIEIRPSPSGAPEAFVNGCPVGASISISHRAGMAICAVAPAGVMLGCDLEAIEPHSEAFIADYFTPEEQALLAASPAQDRLRLLAVLWSAKESTLKALREGLRLDTRSVSVSPIAVPLPPQATWQPLQVRQSGGHTFSGWWQYTADTVRTLVAAPSPHAPVTLESRALIPSADHLESAAMRPQHLPRTSPRRSA